MSDLLILFGVGLIGIGLLWGLVLAFKRSTISGVAMLLVGLSWVPIFLLLARPEGFQKPLVLLGVGLILAILTRTIG